LTAHSNSHSTFFFFNSRRGNTKASGKEAAEVVMEGVVEGDGSAEGSDNLNQLPSTSSSISTNAPDLATSSSATTNTNPSSSGAQATGSGANCNYNNITNVLLELKNYVKTCRV